MANRSTSPRSSQGQRYSIVAFLHTSTQELRHGQKEYLKHLGFALPVQWYTAPAHGGAVGPASVTGGISPPVTGDILEFCCGDQSLIGDMAPLGCRVLRITEEHDVTTQAGIAYTCSCIQQSTGPLLIWASMPCTGGSSWQRINWHKSDDTKARIQQHWKTFGMIWEAFVNICKYAKSIRSHVFVAIEWPQSCAYWEWDSIKDFITEYVLHAYIVDACMYDMWSVKAWEDTRLQKTFRISTNSACIGAHLSRRCDGSHTHMRVEGKDTKLSEDYTPSFAQALHVGWVAQLHALAAAQGPALPRTGSLALIAMQAASSSGPAAAPKRRWDLAAPASSQGGDVVPAAQGGDVVPANFRYPHPSGPEPFGAPTDLGDPAVDTRARQLIIGAPEGVSRASRLATVKARCYQWLLSTMYLDDQSSVPVIMNSGIAETTDLMLDTMTQLLAEKEYFSYPAPATYKALLGIADGRDVVPAEQGGDVVPAFSIPGIQHPDYAPVFIVSDSTGIAYPPECMTQKKAPGNSVWTTFGDKARRWNPNIKHVAVGNGNYADIARVLTANNTKTDVVVIIWNFNDFNSKPPTVAKSTKNFWQTLDKALPELEARIATVVRAASEYRHVVALIGGPPGYWSLGGRSTVPAGYDQLVDHAAKKFQEYGIHAVRGAAFYAAIEQYRTLDGWHFAGTEQCINAWADAIHHLTTLAQVSNFPRGYQGGDVVPAFSVPNEVQGKAIPIASLPPLNLGNLLPRGSFPPEAGNPGITCAFNLTAPPIVGSTPTEQPNVRVVTDLEERAEARRQVAEARAASIIAQVLPPLPPKTPPTAAKSGVAAPPFYAGGLPQPSRPQPPPPPIPAKAPPLQLPSPPAEVTQQREEMERAARALRETADAWEQRHAAAAARLVRAGGDDRRHVQGRAATP